MRRKRYAERLTKTGEQLRPELVWQPQDCCGGRSTGQQPSPLVFQGLKYWDQVPLLFIGSHQYWQPSWLLRASRKSSLRDLKLRGQEEGNRWEEHGQYKLIDSFLPGSCQWQIARVPLCVSTKNILSDYLRNS